MSDDAPRPPFVPYYDATAVDRPELWAQKRRVTEALRRVIHRLALADAGVEELGSLAGELEAAADRLEAADELERSLSPQPDGPGVAAFFDRSPILGLSNPIAPPIALGRSGPTTAVATVTFGDAYEGPPGHVHGGWVAAVFDEVLGYTQTFGEGHGMTGRLEIEYLAPTPLHTELVFVGELLRVEGRKIFTEARLHAGDTLTARAEGLFVAIPPDVLNALGDDRETDSSD